MVKCKICGKEFKDLYSVSKHLKIHNISSLSYFNKHIGHFGKCILCGNKTNFISLVKGYSKYCSSKCSNNSEEVKKKKKQTCLKNYDVENPMQSEEIRETHKYTCLRKYGVENPSQSEETKKKKILAYLQHYGVFHPLNHPDIKKTIKDTCLRRYGVENVSQYLIINKKIKESYIKSFFEKLLNSDRLKGKVIPNFTLDEYHGVHYKYSWICTKCEQPFEGHINNANIPRCPTCYPSSGGSSKSEKEVADFVKSLGIQIKTNTRKLISPLELDIYVPSHKLAIEFNGLYWHSELNGKDKNYHLNKTLQCKSKGIQLLHIFEDEWIDKQEIVKSIITAKLGLIQNKLYARKCIIKSVPSNEAKLFLFDNHLQGPINGTHLGLYYNEELLSLLTYGKSRFNKSWNYEILRFCNKINISVTGGLSKLLKHANLNSVITYADLRYGTGESYLKCGFTYHKQTPPSYYYLDKNIQRFNRLQFQKHLLSEKLDIFDSDLTEWQNMQLNDYDRIWDCGTISYVWNKKGEL